MLAHRCGSEGILTEALTPGKRDRQVPVPIAQLVRAAPPRGRSRVQSPLGNTARLADISSLSNRTRWIDYS